MSFTMAEVWRVLVIRQKLLALWKDTGYTPVDVKCGESIEYVALWRALDYIIGARGCHLL